MNGDLKENDFEKDKSSSPFTGRLTIINIFITNQLLSGAALVPFNSSNIPKDKL